MKPFPTLTFFAALAVLGLTACGKKEAAAPQSDAAAASHAAHAAAAPAAQEIQEPAQDLAPATTAGSQSVKVIANDQMKFNVTRIEASAGSTISITLVNEGKLPKSAMGHNLVVLKKSANAMQFANAAMTAVKTEYIPAAMADQVIAHTKMLGPGESDTITFTVPAETGEYVFLCSFPAHFMAGMKGILVVK